MKSILIITFQLLVLSAFPQGTKTIYTCPMHPEVQMSKPGNCPKCGMPLIKKTVKATPVKKTPVKKAVTKPSVKKTAVKTSPEKKPVNTDHRNEIYTCPMHPEVQSDKPGKCPKCGMTLVKAKVENTKPVEVKDSAVYTCPMHPEVISDKPGSCPKCGMDLVKRSDQPPPPVTDTTTETKTVYTCVMHPEVQSDKPGNCPKCGMVLVKKTIGVNKEEAPVVDAAYIPLQVNTASARTVRYDLYVRDTMVNFTGKTKKAIAINGMIPSPALVFTEGDSAEIHLHNMLDEETSLHWHGVILPNQADGVPFLTTAPVHAGETHVYKFKVVQNGTYWYHSHSALQEQQGIYGALIFKPAVTVASTTEQDGTVNNTLLQSDPVHHLNLVLSEWTDDNPMQIQRRLRTGNDWFAIKKGSTQSYSEAIAQGYFKTKFINEWKRMKAMDVSDVFYEKFLANGKPEASEQKFRSGEKIRLHVVNAGASTYFWLGYAGGKITVIGNDGNDMSPVAVDRLIIAPAETYDLEVTIPADMSYEFRATAEDRTGYSSLWLGSGMRMPAPTLPRLKYFKGMKMMNEMMKTNGEMDDMGMKMSLQEMDMNMVMYPEITGDEEAPMQKDDMQNMVHTGHTMPANGGDIVTLNYNMLRSPVKTALPDGPKKVLHFSLTGNMNRYVWTLNNKTVTETDRILINKGAVLQLVLTNNSMMRHPMHLHGHDFRVVNSAGSYSPLKNVIDIMPMETDTIKFAANQDGNWFFHCHILYHMMAGMGRVFTYNNSAVNQELPDAADAWKKFRKHRDNTMKHLMARIGIEYNGSDGEAMLSNNRYALKQMWHLGYMPEHGYESETMLGRYFGTNQWWFPYIGYDYHYKKPEAMHASAKDERNMFGQVSKKNNRSTYVAGVEYTLPWLMLADARVDGDGNFRFQLSREDIPVTKRLRMFMMGNTDREYAVGFRYVISKWLAASTHYDSDMGLGAGVTITY